MPFRRMLPLLHASMRPGAYAKMPTSHIVIKRPGADAGINHVLYDRRYGASMWPGADAGISSMQPSYSMAFNVARRERRINETENRKLCLQRDASMWPGADAGINVLDKLAQPDCHWQLQCGPARTPGSTKTQTTADVLTFIELQCGPARTPGSTAQEQSRTRVRHHSHLCNRMICQVMYDSS